MLKQSTGRSCSRRSGAGLGVLLALSTSGCDMWRIDPQLADPPLQSVPTTGDPSVSTSSPPTTPSKVDPELGLLLGVWMPTLLLGNQSTEDVDVLQGLNANSIGFTFIFYCDSDNQLLWHVDQAEALDVLVPLVSEYHDAGISVMLAGDIACTDDSPFIPGPISDEIAAEVLDRYTPEMLELASLAEAAEVDIFAPLNELDYRVDPQLASEWGQEIYEGVRERTSAELLWKGSLFDVFVHGDTELDFSGYDALGVSAFPDPGFDQAETDVTRLVDRLVEEADRSGIPRVYMSEFGFRGKDEANRAEAIDLVLRTAAGRVDGYFVVDDPWGQTGPIVGSEHEQLVRDWYATLEESAE